MRALLAAAILVSLVTACQTTRELPQALRPLENEGEIYVYLQPFPEEASRLAFSIEAISAAKSDGTETPLEVSLRDLSGSSVKNQRLLAWGRLPPGNYTGFLVKVARATLATEGGVADLLVPKEPTQVAVAFTVMRASAYVASLAFRYEQSVKKDFGFTPAFSATVVVPSNTITQLAGYCSNTGMADITVFDKRARQVVAVIPTGTEPQGLALDPLANRLYIALAGRDEVQILDLTTGTELRRVALQVGDRPREVRLTPDGKLLVSANLGSNTASFIDPISAVVLNRVTLQPPSSAQVSPTIGQPTPPGEEPWALLVDRGGRRAYVFNRRTSDITVLDLASHAVAATIRTDAEPIRGQLNRDGTRLYVIHAASAYMNVFSVPDYALAGRIYVGLGASAIKVDPRTDLIYVGRRDENRIQVYDPTLPLPVDFIDVPDAVSYMAIDDVENTLLSLMPSRRAVAFIDLTSRKTLSVIDVGNEPYQVVVVGERF